MRSWSAGVAVSQWLVLMMPIVGAGTVATAAEAQRRQDRPFVIKPDGIVLRPNICIKSPELDAAWTKYDQKADAEIRKLADECLGHERDDLLRGGRLPVTPEDAVRTYWSEVEGAMQSLRKAYDNHDDAAAAQAEWSRDVASQIPRRFPEDGEYLLVEDPVTRRGRIIRVENGRVLWLVRTWTEEGACTEKRGESVPLPQNNGQPDITVKNLVNPENRRKVTFTVKVLMQAYTLQLSEPDGRRIADLSGRIDPL